MNIIQKPSPNFNSRGTDKPTVIVVHAMVGTLQGTTALFQRNNSQVSAHYGVGRDGTVVQYVQDDMSAWHVCNANRFCLGIEHEDMFPSPQAALGAKQGLIGGCMGRLDWTTSVQLDASAELCANLMKKYDIAINRVIGHNDQFLRYYGNNHQDPGPLFPWLEYKRRIAKFLVALDHPLKIRPLEVPTDDTPIHIPTFPPQQKKGGRPKKRSIAYND